MFRSRIAPALLAAVVATLLLSTAGQASAGISNPTGGSSPSTRFAPGEIVVRYRPGTPRAARTTLRREIGATSDPSAVVRGLEVLDLPQGTSVGNAIETAESLPSVLYAEPNYQIAATASPNDPLFDEMWSLGLASGDGVNSGIDTPRVWNLTTGSAGVTVAIVDSGIDMSHPDLAPNIYSNAAEVAGNGADDDGNGLVDDSRGWDWVQSDNDPNDEAGHGTLVAGIVGARGNNANGVVGVNWDVRLMPLRVLDAAGSGWTSDVAEAFAYAGREGADVVNASLSGTYRSQAMLDAIAGAPNTLFVVAAGNSSSNVDVAPEYPCSFPLPNVVCVAATSQSDQLSSYSNYGATAVDLAAPGDAILSTWPGGAYNEGWGTSFASPHVAGMAALLQAGHPEASVDVIKSALLGGAAPLAALAGKTVTGGRLSAAGAFERMGDVVPIELRQPRTDDGKDSKRCETKRRRRPGGGNRRKGRRARHGFCRARLPGSN